MKLKTITSIVVLTFSVISPLLGAIKIKSNESQPALFYADSQTYDRDLGILILKGNVEFEHHGSVLEADYVTYNEKTDVVTASGNVRLRQPDGDITFGEYVELTGDLKKGVILCLRTLMEDDSKIVAQEGRKFEDREELDQAVYTPCKLCGDKPPTWQINARRAVKDDVNKDIHFSDAQMRILDIPIFYIPYATQPLERRSGFLIPLPSYHSDFGVNIAIPYFYAISPDKDMTITPVFFTRQNPLLNGQYRQAFRNGMVVAEGSIIKYRPTSKDKKEEKKRDFKIPNVRGYYFLDGKFNLNEIWRFRASGGQVTDKTFFRKFVVSGWKNEPNMTSKGILEGFLTQRDYAVAEVYYFQGLRNQDKQEKISAPLPYVEYNGYSAVDPWGGRFNFESNLLNLVRKEGINVQRGINQVSWRRPWMAPYGQVFTVFGSTRGDLYQVENFGNCSSKNSKHHKSKRHSSKSPFSKEKKGGARFFPQAGLDWRWPFVNSVCGQSFIIQPMGQLIVAPREALGIKARHIPNEDSADFAFNDANLFSPDRFPGYDVIDTGSRAVYGGDFLTTGGLFGDVEVFLGQSYSFTKPNQKDKSQGLGRYASDYVGRIEASPYSWLTLNYRFRLDKKTFDSRVSEVGGSIGPSIAKLAGTYTFVSKHAGTPNKKDFKQINLTLSSQFTEHWTLQGLFRYDLTEKWKKGRLEEGVGLIYRDDCFGLGISVKRQYYKDRDLEPATIVMGTLYLKNVGVESYNWSFNVADGLFGERKPGGKP